MTIPASQASQRSQSKRVRLAEVYFGILLLKSRAGESKPSGLKPELESSVCRSISKERPKMERTCGEWRRGCKVMGINTKVVQQKYRWRPRSPVKAI